MAGLEGEGNGARAKSRRVERESKREIAHAHYVARHPTNPAITADCGLESEGSWGSDAAGKGRTFGANDADGGSKFDPSGTPPGDAPLMSTIRVTEDDPREYKRAGWSNLLFCKKETGP